MDTTDSSEHSVFQVYHSRADFTSRSRRNWSEEETKLLLTLYKELIQQCTSSSSLLRKLTRRLRDAGIPVNFDQVTNKWRNMTRKESKYSKQVRELVALQQRSFASRSVRAHTATSESVNEGDSDQDTDESPKSLNFRWTEDDVKLFWMYCEKLIPYCGTRVHLWTVVGNKLRTQHGKKISDHQVRDKWLNSARTSTRKTPEVERILQLAATQFSTNASPAWPMQHIETLLDLFIDHLSYIQTATEEQMFNILAQKLIAASIEVHACEVQAQWQYVLREKHTFADEMREKILIIEHAMQDARTNTKFSNDIFDEFLDDSQDDNATMTAAECYTKAESEIGPDDDDLITTVAYEESVNGCNTKAPMTEFQEKLLKIMTRREENEQTRHEERMKMKEKELFLLERLLMKQK